MKPFQLLIFLSLLTGLYFSSCQKKETLQIDTETQTLIDNALVEQESLALISGVTKSALYFFNSESSANSLKLGDSIKLVSGDTSTFNPFPNFVLIFSDSEGLRCIPDHKKRVGQVLFYLTGSIKKPGTVLKITYLDYLANNLTYKTDSIVITVLKFSNETCHLESQIYTNTCASNSYSIHYSHNFKLKLEPLSALTTENTNYFMYGKSTGKNRTGVNYMSECDSLNMLMMTSTCMFITKGIQKITNQDGKNFVISYGNGICDELAEYNIFQNAVQFKLK